MKNFQDVVAEANAAIQVLKSDVEDLNRLTLSDLQCEVDSIRSKTYQEEMFLMMSDL